MKVSGLEINLHLWGKVRVVLTNPIVVLGKATSLRGTR